MEAARTLRPALLVVSAASAELLTPMAAELAELAREHEVAVAGAGALDFDPGDSKVLVLTRDPVTEAEGLGGGPS